MVGSLCQNRILFLSPLNPSSILPYRVKRHVGHHAAFTGEGRRFMFFLTSKGEDVLKYFYLIPET